MMCNILRWHKRKNVEACMDGVEGGSVKVMMSGTFIELWKS